MPASAITTYRMTHYDILPPEQRILLPLLGPTRRLGYTLYGGTAIALQLGHRESVDFDFFSERPLDEKRLRMAIPALGSARTTQQEPDTWTMVVRPEDAERDVKVSFFGGLGFGRIGQPTLTDGKEIALASLDDLLGHKLKVLLQRVEAKDYLDIAAMLAAGQSLENGLAAAQALFANFPPAEALRALTYYEGGDLERVGRDERELLSRCVSEVRGQRVVKILSTELGGPLPPGTGGIPPIGYGRGR